MKQERKTERQKMKKQNKRLVAQPKGEGKCHSLTPNANLATVAPRARVGDASASSSTREKYLVAPRARVGDASNVKRQSQVLMSENVSIQAGRRRR